MNVHSIMFCSHYGFAVIINATMACSGNLGRGEETQIPAVFPPSPIESGAMEERPGMPRDNEIQHLFDFLKELNVQTITSDYDIDSVSEKSDEIFCRNILLKDRKGQFFLVIVAENKSKVDLKLLRKTLNAHRNFSFSTAEELLALLNVVPGSVTPFGLIFKKANGLHIIIDNSFAESHLSLNFHPLVPQKTTAIFYKDLVKFIEFCGYSVEVHSVS